jgi:hypothetical protein
VVGNDAVDDAGRRTGESLTQARFALERSDGDWEWAPASKMSFVPGYVTDIARWEEVGRAHGELFREVRLASTLS